MRWLKYLWRAFHARPFGMPVPPLWFGVILAGLAGYFVHPSLYWAGAAGLTLITGLVASNRRFQNTVDATDAVPAPDERGALLQRLDTQGRETQLRLEQQCSELQNVLATAKAGDEHIQGVWQLVQLHLRLLVARGAASAVLDHADAGEDLKAQVEKLQRRRAQPDIDADLKEALEDQQQVIEKRLTMQDEARRRLQLLDSEIERIREQVALIREQALLTSDPGGIRRSVDQLSAFLNESGRWLQEQEKIFGSIDSLDLDLLGPDTPAQRDTGSRQNNDRRVGESQ